MSDTYTVLPDGAGDEEDTEVSVDKASKIEGKRLLIEATTDISVIKDGNGTVVVCSINAS